MSFLDSILADSTFPQALDPTFITSKTSEKDKLGRAEAVVDLFIAKPLAGLNVLDMGCGEGHIAFMMAAKGAKVIAYDPKVDVYKQEEGDNLHHVLTLEEVASTSYDMVLLFDVLDHCVGVGPVEVLKFCKKVLKPSGTMRVRCHPWCSRHSTHIFHSVNKAFIHLFATEEELQEKGFVFEPCVKVIHPKWHYGNWFRESELIPTNKEIHSTPVEPIFSSEPYRSKIMEHYKNSPIDESLRRGEGFPSYALEQTFYDVVLGV